MNGVVLTLQQHLLVHVAMNPAVIQDGSKIDIHIHKVTVVPLITLNTFGLSCIYY